MFKLKITGAQEALDLMSNGWPTAVVSVIQDSADWTPSGPHHLIVTMSDVFSPHMSRDAPSEAHLLKILTHTAKLTSADRLLINCWAGQSRSTATAIAILIQHGCDAQTAFDMVLAERPIALPNGLIIEHADKVFGLNGELIKIVTDHRKSELSKPYIVSTDPSVSDVNAMKNILALLSSKPSGPND